MDSLPEMEAPILEGDAGQRKAGPTLPQDHRFAVLEKPLRSSPKQVRSRRHSMSFGRPRSLELRPSVFTAQKMLSHFLGMYPPNRSAIGSPLRPTETRFARFLCDGRLPSPRVLRTLGFGRLLLFRPRRFARGLGTPLALARPVGL